MVLRRRYGLRIPGIGFRIPRLWNLDSWFQTLAAFRIPLGEVLILRQGIPDSTSKNLPGIQSLAYLTRSGKLFILLPVIIG